MLKQCKIKERKIAIEVLFLKTKNTHSNVGGGPTIVMKCTANTFAPV